MYIVKSLSDKWKLQRKKNAFDIYVDVFLDRNKDYFLIVILIIKKHDHVINPLTKQFLQSFKTFQWNIIFSYVNDNLVTNRTTKRPVS